MDIEVFVCCGPDLKHARGRFPALVNEPGSTLLVAWADDIAVGHLQIRWAGSVHGHVKAAFGPVPEIRRLRVHGDSQRRGVALLLLTAAEEMIADQGYRSVGLAVGVGNEAARGLYERVGYGDSGLDPFESAWGLDDAGNHYRHFVSYLVREISAEANGAVEDHSSRHLVVA